MKRMILGMLLVLSITGLATYSFAQNKFTREKRMLRYARMGGGVDEKLGVAKLTWSFSPDLEYTILIKFNKSGDIYFIKRVMPDGIDGFAKGKALIETLIKEGSKVEYKNEAEMDWYQPYVLRQIENNRYSVEGYYETSEIEKLFKVLDQILHLRVIPISKGEPGFNLTYTEMEVGDALTFPMRKKWLWK